jgi:hypothetical protein
VLSPSPANISVSESIYKKRSHKSIALAERQEYVRKLFTDNGPLSHIWAYFPYLVKLNHHRSVPFLVNIIGDAVMTGNGHVNPLDIFHRLELAQKEASTFSHTAHVKNANLGKAWTKHVAGGREALLNVQKGVADFLKEMSKKGYRTNWLASPFPIAAPLIRHSQLSTISRITVLPLTTQTPPLLYRLSPNMVSCATLTFWWTLAAKKHPP